MDKKRVFLYEQLYLTLKEDIISGKYRKGAKLPSKRSLSEQYRVSVITVENALEQLIAEGYINAVERSGCFVQYSKSAGGEVLHKKGERPPEPDISGEIPAEKSLYSGLFPFTVWARLMRAVILEQENSLLQPVRSGGAAELKAAICDYLYRCRGLYVHPRQIIIGSGAEYLYNLLIQFLGRDKKYGLEDPAYNVLTRIYGLNGADCTYIGLDRQGLSVKELKGSGVEVVHISPAHHFPTGIVMPITRRKEIMAWAEEAPDRYIIEDDYDSEFRWTGRPLPPMFGSDPSGRVIYINTFSRTIAPSVRISYLCLPLKLLDLWEEKMGFYACPVPAFEQYTLAKFISEGYFERHINRMRKHYRRVRETVLKAVASCAGTEIREENAGLHFILRAIDGAERIIEAAGKCGIRITPISHYYNNSTAPKNVYAVNYANADIDGVEREFERAREGRE